MNEIFFTSDTHFCHQPSFLWEPRGFSSVEEMNEAIIENWNKIVKPNDIVYHLGDTMLNDNKKGIECFKRLNGQIFLTFGNHETEVRKNLLFSECHDKILGGWYAYVIKHGKLSIYMGHYPTLTANYDEKHFNQHVIALHGHTHQQANFLYPNNPFCYHVGMDSHDCTPVNIEEIIGEVRQRWFDLQSLKIPVEDLYTYPMKGE